MKYKEMGSYNSNVFGLEAVKLIFWRKYGSKTNSLKFISIDKLSGDALVGLFFVAIAHALVVAVMISAAHISGGHLNPAVTLGLLVGGHITIVRSILYWIDQLIASAAACYLLHYLSGGLVSSQIFIYYLVKVITSYVKNHQFYDKQIWIETKITICNI